MAIVEESFPRGRKAYVEKKNRPVAEKRRKNDGLFNVSGGKRKPKKTIQKKKMLKNVKKKKQAEESLTKKEKKKIEKENSMLDSIEPLSYKMVTEGLKILGKVQEVREIDLLLSLPGRIQAVVPITNISTPYTKLLNQMAEDETADPNHLKEIIKEGDIFPCCIKEVTNDGSFKVTASLNPADVNGDLPTTALSKGLKLIAAVQSVEDHGFVMDIGLVNARCFMPKASDHQLSVGQIVNVCVTTCEVDGHVATLTVSTTESIKFKQNVELNIATLIPATKVHVTVTKVYPQGLAVSFGNLVGYVHRDHLATSTDTPSSYEKSTNLQAIVLYTVPLVNAVYLSLKPSLIKPKTKKPAFEIGQIIEGIVSEATAAGIFFQLSSTVKGFVPLRHLSDNQDIFEDIKSLFPVKTKKRCRILSYASLDEIYICTMRKSLLEQKALRYEDFTVGEVLEAKIESLMPTGISLNLGINLKGFIPKLHWADDPRLKKPELRFRPGQKITCRVLKVMAERKKIHLTCKKSLMDADNVPAYNDVSQLEKGMVYKGTVTLIENGGVLVTFFGDLSGWMPRHWLQKKGIPDISRFFFLGQLVDCKVHSIEETGKVMLNLAKVDNLGSETKVSKPLKALGTIVKCRVEKVFQEGQEGSCGLEVSIPSLDAKGFIPVEHLTDFPKVAPLLLQCFKPGDVIEDAVIWLTSKLQTVLTLKPTIVNCVKANNFPPSANEIGVNSIFPMVSTTHMTFGVFATLLCPPQSCQVLFPHSQLPSKLYSSLEKDVRHLTMEGKIIKVDSETKKVFVGLNGTASIENSVMLLKSYLEQQDKLKTHLMKSSDERLKSLSSMKLGDVVVGKLSMEFDPAADLEFDLPHGVKGIVPAYHHSQKNFKKNDLIVGSVLYSDLVRQVVFVTTRPDVIHRIAGANASQPHGNKPDSKIILNTDYFSLASVVDGDAKNVVFVSNLKNINEIFAPLKPPFSLGTKVELVCSAENGQVATYQKLPKSWSVVRSNKRVASTDDGPKSKKSKKEVKTAVNSKEEPTRKKKAQQVTDMNAASETQEAIKEAEPCSVAVNKSSTKKKTNGWQVELVSDAANEDPSTKNNKTASTNGNNQNKKASNEKDTESGAEGIEPVDKTGAKKKSAAKRKEQGADGTAAQKSSSVENGEPKKDTTPSKKRKMEVVKDKNSIPVNLPRLTIATKFKWDDDMTGLPLLSTTMASDSSDSEDENADGGKVVVKDRRERARQKLEQAKLDEAKLSQIEEELNDPDRAPVTADDFDRMVLASPNSSILWLQYMAFHLENAEIERARTVAQRALKIISFREEQEKFNVWIALLNLEHMYGTTESYENALKEALRYNEPFKVHRQMALNFEQNNKYEEAEALYTTMMKKYKQNKSVWMNACLFYVRNSKLDTARGVFQKALTILDKKEHIDLISRFAQLEMKFGQLERGKTLFDTMMMSYPKRTDLWLVYIDTLTKVDDIESARQVLERCITLQLPAKKMKTIFQKFLEFETQHGDVERQNYVRKKALDYVESKTEALDD